MSSSPTSTTLAPEPVCRIIVESLRPGRFFVQLPATVELEYVHRQELTWEIYHGRLLDASQTRRRQSFESWNLYWIDVECKSGEPLLSVKFDADDNVLHVTRGIECYGWEAYDDGNNVILSREVRKWTRELVATLDLGAYSNLDHLRDDLGFRLFQAVIGTSRLPLTSLEAPLPGFTLGKLGYFPNLPAGDRSLRSGTEIVEQALTSEQSNLEKAKLLELVLRGSSAVELLFLPSRLARRLPEVGGALSEFPALVRAVFDEVALSPYTLFVDRMLALLKGMKEESFLSIDAYADILTAILRRLGRHLTAFDLVTFHHRGANYPDLLLLDAVLKAVIDVIERRRPDLFVPFSIHPDQEGQTRLLRLRGLRQGYFFRRRYQGHPVPTVPTSPGENMRVLPSPIPHLSEEQVLDPACRDRRLFADDPIESCLTPTAQEVLQFSWESLADPAELQELGTALFLDRPLGIFKHPTEPDQTLLLSYVAFSRTVAERRLVEIRDLGLLDDDALLKLQQALTSLQVDGIPLAMRPVPARPGVASLQDAFKVAPDFVLLRTTQRSMHDFILQFDLAEVTRRFAQDSFHWGQGDLIVGGGAVKGQGIASLTVYDSSRRPRLEFAFNPEGKFRFHRCHEYPAGGLHLVRVWEPDAGGATMIERDVSGENVRVGPPK